MTEAVSNAVTETASTLSRRGLIGGATALALAAAIPGIGRLAQSVDRPGTTVFDQVSFERFVGDQFILLGAPLGMRSLQLHKVRAGDSRPVPGKLPRRTESFSLLFRGPQRQPLGQDVYRLKHRTLGTMSLLLVPMQPDPGTQYLEAVFNFLRPS